MADDSKPEFRYVYVKHDDRRGMRLRIVGTGARTQMVLVRFEGDEEDAVVNRNHFKRMDK